MRAFVFIRQLVFARRALVRGLAVLLLLAACPGARAAVPFTVVLSGDGNGPRVRVTNESRRRITHFEMTIGDLNKHFDTGAYSLTEPPGGSAVNLNGGRTDQISINLTGFDGGETFSFYFDPDTDPDVNEVLNYRTVLFNNGTAMNSIIRVTDDAGNTEELELPDPGAADLGSYTFHSKSRSRALTVKSVSEEGASDYVRKVQVKVNGIPVRTNSAGTLILTSDTSQGILLVGAQESMTVYDDEVVEIIAPQEVYKNILGADISDSVIADSDNILRYAEERYTSIGLSVNNVAQTGDPTYYRFNIAADTDILVKWQHDFALSIGQDFGATASSEINYAGPLSSVAEGNPDPPAPKAWVRKGAIVSPTVAGQVVDFSSHPGLDIRYVNTGYRAGGSAHRANAGSVFVGTNFVEGVYSWSEQGTSLGTNATTRPAASRLTPPDRQQVTGFTMSGPARIIYIWQIQYGVKVNVDSLSRSSIPRIFTPSPTNSSLFVETASGEGTFWFNPFDRVRIATPVTNNNLAVNGWLNGDGYYFGSSGTISPVDGSLFLADSVGTNAAWQTFFTVGNQNYRGVEIPHLNRPARVLWTYGNLGLATTATIGEHVFQHDSLNASKFLSPPVIVTALNISGRNQSVAVSECTLWDPQAQRLFPLVPGTFGLTWVQGVAPNQVTNYVILTALYPTNAHYPHIAGAPGVALDPDPADNLIFKSIKYSENAASVDGSMRFFATNAGKTVLQFGNLQRTGRGEPREFVAVRVVETKNYSSVLDSGEAVIGRKIQAPDLDKANLGTGYVMSFAEGSGQPDRQRFNPFVYDAGKLTGLAAKDVYDMTKLNSTTHTLEVVHKENLPGPIIPVNLHPGALPTERVIVLWYANPTTTDGLLWPARARSYTNRWPTSVEGGLGRITIASQFGSESQILSNNTAIADQIITPEMNIAGLTFPAETTYNPSRFQQVQIYNQPDRTRRGYNPNEEHALMAPSLRYADVSPRPSAAYALRYNDLNQYNLNSLTEANQAASTYSSHPYVLVQFFDSADQEFKMRVYQVSAEDADVANAGLRNYKFAQASIFTLTNADGTVTATATALASQPYVGMKAGEPVIPFYPLGVVIGASPCVQSFGVNIKGQSTYWKDHKGTFWAISGDANSWFTMSFYYPMQPDFWWPPGTPGFLQDIGGGSLTGAFPQAGDCVAFMPTGITNLLAQPANSVLAANVVTEARPNKILFKSDWPDVAPVLKAGETLTFSGGEYRADHPTTPIIDPDGNPDLVPTPGLPGIVAFATAEVVFDSLNPSGTNNLWPSSWTARVVQALDVRSVPLTLGNFPVELSPASGRTRVKQGKYVFNDLPASLQKRVRYDPLLFKLEMSGLLNDKAIGDNTLTASPGAVYVLEPNILTEDDRNVLQSLDDNAGSAWDNAVQALFALTRNPNGLTGPTFQNIDYLTGLEQEIVRDQTGAPVTNTLVLPRVPLRNPSNAAPYRAFGPGLALVPNAGFLHPNGVIPPGNTPFPDVSWVVVAENNDDSLGGSPVTVHVIKVDRHERYRGAIKTITSDNVFDENLVLRHTGDFGANANELVFEWWYRPDDGSFPLPPPPDLIPASQTSPWKLFPDPTGKRGVGRYLITLKGNPNAPEALLADTFWFCRYRHKNDVVQDSNWNVPQPDFSPRVNFTWAGAGNSQPFVDLDADGFPDYRAQLAQGWIKRVLDAVNPYEARIRDFDGDNPSTIASMIQQFGARYEGPVALNADKNVIENVGLIELYETILKRGRDLSIDLSRPVSTPAIANALQLASTRIADFYTTLGNEAYVDALDPTIGFGSEPGNDLSGSNPGYGSLAPAVFCFQNQMSSLIEEELGLLRGVDDYFARPVYNRLFWNFTKGEGEAAYAVNYNLQDKNLDGFINSTDAMLSFPQGHGDAWGHYLTALRHHYDLLRNRNFNWVSRSEFYNLQDIVIKVDFLDERKFAQEAAAKAKVGAEVVNLTYRQKYVQDPNAQWQGYTDSQKDRAWGVQEWARRAGQGAYFDWVTANALLPSKHPNTALEGIQKVDRQENSDIAVVSANLNSIQTTFDQANAGLNPLGISRDGMVFDIDPTFLEVGSTAQIGTRAVQGLLHFDQIYERALKMLDQMKAVWNNANEARNHLRTVGNSELEFRNATFQEDLSYRNQLIKIFGKPYEGTIGPGKLYPAGYDGPDLLLYMYVDVRTVDNNTVPGPAASFATFGTNGAVNGGDIYSAYLNGTGNELGSPPGGAGANQTINEGVDSILSGFQNVKMHDIANSVRVLFSPTFAESSGVTPILARDGLFAVNYTDLVTPKVPLLNLTNLLPVTAAGYTFQAPREWGKRLATGELQTHINQMIQQEAAIASAVGAWDSLQGDILRTLRLINAKVNTSADIRLKNEVFSRIKTITLAVLASAEGVKEALDATKDTVTAAFGAGAGSIPKNLPTGGLAISPGDALAPAAAAFSLAGATVSSGVGWGITAIKIAKIIAENGLEIAANELALSIKREEDALAAKEMIVELENKVGDEPIKRIEIFKEIQNLRELSDQYRSMVDEGSRLIDERAAFNKRVAAQTQRNRYQDATFRVARNHALETYRASFDLAARYSYLAAKAYDYETNFDPSDPGSPADIYGDIMRARTLGLFDGEPRMGQGGLSEALAKLKLNYEVLKGQLGINNPQIEIGKLSLRTENFRILPKADPVEQVSVDYLTNTTANATTITTVTTLASPSAQQPADGVYGFGAAGQDSDALWQQTLENARVDDLWQVPEFRQFCRPFASETNSAGGHVAEPGIVIRFGTEITAGKNAFGKPLAGGDHAFDPAHYATKIQSVGVWMSDYLSSDPVGDLTATPRVYLIPAGDDVMSISRSSDPGLVRIWKVLDQRIPVPLPATSARLDEANWIPLLDSLNGQFGENRQYSTFRAYHDGTSTVDLDELVADTRLVARSVWNTKWALIIPGRLLNADPNVGLDRFIAQVSDLKLVFRTYGISGN